MSTPKNTSITATLIAVLVAIATFLGIVQTYTDFFARAYGAFTTYAVLEFFLAPSKPVLIAALVIAVSGFAWPQLLPRTKLSSQRRVVQVSRIVAITCWIYVAFIIISPKPTRVMYVVYENNVKQIHPKDIDVGELAVQGIQVSDIKKLTSVGDFRKNSIILSAADRPWHEVVEMLDDSKIHSSVYSLRETLPVSTTATTDIGVSSYIGEFRQLLKSKPISINNTIIVFERQYAEAESQLQSSLRGDGATKPSLVFDSNVPLNFSGGTTSDVAFFLGSYAGLQLFSERAKTLKPDMAVIAPNWVRHRLTCTPVSSTPTPEEIRGLRFCLVSVTYEQLLSGDFRLWTKLIVALRDLSGTPGNVYEEKKRDHIATAIGASDVVQLVEFK